MCHGHSPLWGRNPRERRRVTGNPVLTGDTEGRKGDRPALLPAGSTCPGLSVGLGAVLLLLAL